MIPLYSNQTKASAIELRRAPGGRLVLLQETGNIYVEATPCFPFSDPDSAISLRDEDGIELAMVSHITALDAPSAEALCEDLHVNRFLIEIEEVERVKQVFELFHWDVQTKAGPRKFQTDREAKPRQMSDGSLMIHDICGDLFVIRDPSLLSERSRKQIWEYID